MSGYRLRVFDPDPKRVRLLQDEEGVVVVKSVTQVASPSGVVLSPVLENGIHLSLSTISPECAEWAAQRYHVVGKGSTYLSGTVLGRPTLAEAARLTILFSGPQEPKARVIPLLRLLSGGALSES